MTIILFLGYLFFGRVVPWSMAVTLALYLGRKPNLRGSLILLLAVGWLEDIAYVRPLGLTSVILVTLTAAMWLFERLYRSKNQWWWFGLGVVGEVGMWLIGRQKLLWLAVGGQLLALMVIYWIGRHLREPEGIYVG